MQLPKLYYQIEKIRDAWKRSKSSQKDEMIKLFDEYLDDIVIESLLESEDSTTDFEAIEELNKEFKGFH